MARGSRGQPPKELQRKVKPASRLYFLEGELMRADEIVVSSNIVYLTNVTKGTTHTMLYTDFKKHRKRAYTVAAAAALLDRGSAQMRRYINSGLIKAPVGGMIGGVRKFGIHAYYSEDDLFDIREALTTVHRGRPRADGKVTPSRVLTEAQLRARMGDALMLYTRTEDGRFVPVWAEETY